MPLSKIALLCLENNSFLAQDIMLGRYKKENQEFAASNREFQKEHEKYRQNRNLFFKHTRMSVHTFDYILDGIRPILENKAYLSRSVSTEVKLIMTLRYLSSGESFTALAQFFSVGKSTVGKMMYQTLSAIWTTFANRHLPRKLTTNDLTRISDNFLLKTQFPNCVGAIGNKHFRVMKKREKCILVLQSVSDANYKFTAIKVVKKQNTVIAKKFANLKELFPNSTFKMPPPKKLPGSDIICPHVLVGDIGFPLKTYLMKPFPSRKADISTKRNFNKRLSRAREAVDCVHGILESKWKLFQSPIETDRKHSSLLIKVACLLHNIIRDLEGDFDHDFQEYMQSGIVQRKFIKSRRNNRASTLAIAIRNLFMEYFAEDEQNGIII